MTFAYQLTYTNIKKRKGNFREFVDGFGQYGFDSKMESRSFLRDMISYNKGVTFTQFRFERDLLSWRMDFNWTPFGTYAYWSFFIGIKSSVLSDIKWEKRTTPDKSFEVGEEKKQDRVRYDE